MRFSSLTSLETRQNKQGTLKTRHDEKVPQRDGGLCSEAGPKSFMIGNPKPPEKKTKKETKKNGFGSPGAPSKPPRGFSQKGRRASRQRRGITARPPPPSAQAPFPLRRLPPSGLRHPAVAERRVAALHEAGVELRLRHGRGSSPDATRVVQMTQWTPLGSTYGFPFVADTPTLDPPIWHWMVVSNGLISHGDIMSTLDGFPSCNLQIDQIPSIWGDGWSTKNSFTNISVS